MPGVTFTGDAGQRIAIAAWVLFTTEPTDRALAGWNGTDWAGDELDAMRAWVRAAAMREVA